MYTRDVVLPKFETHLTDHCNLNCKGCGHYCPVAPPIYTDIDEYRYDLRGLKLHFSNIARIRLMGGEPLLHPDPASFIISTREAFPESDIRFVTNGILLDRASAAFWKSCMETGTVIDLTLYPLFRDRAPGWQSLCRDHEVQLNMSREIQTFFAHMNLKGNSDTATAFQVCKSQFVCPFLRNGRIYTCAIPALVPFFNDRFGYAIATDEGINIHSPTTTGRKILEYLNRPIETCRWCSYELPSFPWAVSKRNVEEWDAGRLLQGAHGGSRLQQQGAAAG